MRIAFFNLIANPLGSWCLNMVSFNRANTKQNFKIIILLGIQVLAKRNETGMEKTHILSFSVSLILRLV